MKKSKLSVTGISLSKICMIGTGISVMLLIIFAMISAIFISNEYFDIGASGYLAGIVQFLAIFVGCIIAGKLVKEGRVLACAIVGGACVFIQLAASILFFGGISGRFIPGILANIAGCGGAILLSVSNKNRSASRKRRIRSR